MELGHMSNKKILMREKRGIKHGRGKNFLLGEGEMILLKGTLGKKRLLKDKYVNAT